jgi:nicotinamide mononucleotide adenylyltransferase
MSNDPLVASVHGGFQLLHNEHIRYILGAKAKCDLLIIGITQHDIHKLVETPEDPHRHEPSENPLTFDERNEIIHQALLKYNLREEQFRVVPFPIEMPSTLTSYIPINVPIFTTLCGEWSKHKIQLLQSIGYHVEILWSNKDKTVDGTVIRDLICKGDDSWKQKVPNATIEFVEKHDIRQRILDLRKVESKR